MNTGIRIKYYLANPPKFYHAFGNDRD